jgi:hypothetical protein
LLGAFDQISAAIGEFAMKLFMFYVGGDCGNANVELHDVRFSIGDSPEDCYEDLRQQWWGTPKSLHLDCWGPVEQADGFDVTLTTDPSGDQTFRLFFVNLGGYSPLDFAELHKNVLIVASDAASAKQKAMMQTNGWSLPHKDRLFEVEKAVDLTALLRGYGRFISLTPATTEKPFAFQCDYRPIA